MDSLEAVPSTSSSTNSKGLRLFGQAVDNFLKIGDRAVRVKGGSNLLDTTPILHGDIAVAAIVHLAVVLGSFHFVLKEGEKERGVEYSDLLLQNKQ